MAESFPDSGYHSYGAEMKRQSSSISQPMLDLSSMQFSDTMPESSYSGQQFVADPAISSHFATYPPNSLDLIDPVDGILADSPDGYPTEIPSYMILSTGTQNPVQLPSYTIPSIAQLSQTVIPPSIARSAADPFNSMQLDDPSRLQQEAKQQSLPPASARPRTRRMTGQSSHTSMGSSSIVSQTSPRFHTKSRKRQVAGGGHEEIVTPTRSRKRSRSSSSPLGSIFCNCGCNKSYKDEAAVRKHKSQPRHPCNILTEEGEPCQSSSTTLNDLNRHKLTVHHLWTPGTKFYFCKDCPDASKPKMWPRWDNFKAHVHRSHPLVDLAHIEHEFTLYDPAQHGHLVKQSRHHNRNVDSVAHSVAAGRSPPVTRDLVHLRQYRGQQRYMPSQGRQQRVLLPTSLPHGYAHSVATIDPMLLDSQASLDRDALSLTDQNYYDSYAKPGAPATVADPQDFRHTVSTLDFVSHGLAEKDDFDGGISADADMDLPGFGSNLDMSDSGVNMQSVASSLLPKHIGTVDESTLGQTKISVRAILSRLMIVNPDEVADFIDEYRDKRTTMSDPRTGSIIGRASGSRIKADDMELLSCDLKAMIGDGPCLSKFKNASDLRKHHKKHAMIYRCTFDRCDQRWGTKYQWARHEFRKHVQHLQWRCQPIGLTGETCTFWEKHEAQFIKHVKAEHPRLEGLELQRYVDNCRLDKQWQRAFWCGFCNRTVLNNTGEEGPGRAKARYDHIEKHLLSGEFQMDDWVEIEGGGKTKGEVRQARHAELRGDDDPEIHDEVDTDDYEYGRGTRASLSSSRPTRHSRTASSSSQQDPTVPEVIISQAEEASSFTPVSPNQDQSSFLPWDERGLYISRSFTRRRCGYCRSLGEENDPSLECRVCGRLY